jgi:RNA-binding protein PNO1
VTNESFELPRGIYTPELFKTMVVTHASTIIATSSTPPTKTKKTRRKLSRKNPAPSTTSQQNNDEEMVIGAPGEETSNPNSQDDDELMIDTDLTQLAPPTTDAPSFAPVAPGAEKSTLKSETRRIPIPPHRMTPLKKDWLHIFGPLTEILGLQVRMNVQRRSVEIRVRSLFKKKTPSHLLTLPNNQTSKHTKDIGALQKGADFVKAYALGFDVNVRFDSVCPLNTNHFCQDAIALLRLDDLYLDSFEIKDVKTLHGDHLSRAIGRIAGQDGKTKFTIENTSRTRIVLADTYVKLF